jgi:hypothetical protein
LECNISPDFPLEPGSNPDHPITVDDQRGGPDTDTVIHARITVTISIVDAGSAIEVPLGAYRAGRWEAVPKLENVFEMFPDDLADDLTGDNLLHDLLLMSREEVLELVEHAHARCVALAAAATTQQADYTST